MTPALTFHHGGVSVPDLDAAIARYGRVLGFALERRFRIEAADADVAFVRRDALRFELFEVAGAAPLPADRRSVREDLRTHGNKHVALAVADLATFLDDVRAHDADVALIVSEDFGSGCFLRDCAGNLIEIVEAAA